MILPQLLGPIKRIRGVIQGLGLRGILPQTMENQIAKKMENEVGTGVTSVSVSCPEATEERFLSAARRIPARP